MRNASTRLSPVLGNLHQRHFAFQRRAFDGEVGDAVHRHQALQLVLDLLDDHRRAGGHDGDAREVLRGIDLGHRQALDVVAAAREQADDAGEDTGSRCPPAPTSYGVRSLYLSRLQLPRPDLLAPADGSRHARDNPQIAMLRIAHDQTSTMPSSETGSAV